MKRLALVIYVIVQLIGTMAFASTWCGGDVLKTPAVYFEFIGESDKPIYPIVIAVRRPRTAELKCALPSLDPLGAAVFVVDQKELADVDNLVESAPNESKSSKAEFSCVVLKMDSVKKFRLDLGASKKLFANLRAYFGDRNPELRDRLETLVRRLGA